MATVTKRRRQKEDPDATLKVSSYDNVSSVIVTLIIFLGFFVLLLFVIWLTKALTFVPVSVPVVFVEEKSGRADHAKGYARDLAEPGLEEMEQLVEPQLEAMLEAVTDTVSTKASSLDSLSTDATFSGKGSGLGDSRAAGEGGEGDGIPRQERWLIEYQSDNLDRYAQQLDFFGIELGAAGGGSKFIDYATNLSKNPVTRQGTSKQEKRLYFTWNSGQLRQMDASLLGRAGIKTSNRVLMHFFAEDLENQIHQVEMAYAVTHGIDHVRYIRKTIFRVTGSAGAFRFEVVSQIRRDLPK